VFYGQILAEDTSSKRPEALLVEDVPIGPGRTLYSAYGDWFSWVCVFALIALLSASKSASFVTGKYQELDKRN
jgi:hypothetical protein